jgi:hypothetical protein
MKNENDQLISDVEIKFLKRDIQRNRRSAISGFLVMMITLSVLSYDFYNYTSLHPFTLICCGIMIVNFIFIGMFTFFYLIDYKYNKSLLNEYLRINA